MRTILAAALSWSSARSLVAPRTPLRRVASSMGGTSSRADVLQLHRWLRAELTRMADAVGGLRRQGDGSSARGGTGAGWAETYGSGEELRDLLSRVVYEIARQESTHCVERARLLLQVWVLHETLCVSGVIAVSYTHLTLPTKA